jgi:tetratricopeptide (TPR) repeat protein
MAGTFQDRYGLLLSTHSQAAAEQYCAGIDIMLAHNAGAQETLEAAVAADDGLALAHIALARWFQYVGNMPAAQASKNRALACLDGATRRERQHVQALAQAIDGNGPTALVLIREHLQDFPRDAFALKQADGPFGLIGFGGGQDRLEANFVLLDSVADAYGDDWWFLSAYAFAHNELGHYTEARRLVDRSLALHPRSGHGAHTMAHVFFETGQAQSGAAFLDEWLPDYPRQSQMYSHLTWHLALFELAADRPERARALYEETLRPEVSPGVPLITLCDAAALMWRHDLYGLDRPAGSRAEIANLARRAFSRPGITFADVHCALAYAAAGELEALEQLVGQLQERLAAGQLPAGAVVPAIVRALAAFARGDYEGTVQLLEPVAAQVVRIGGSNAQRQVIEDTLLQAYLRSGRYEAAEALLRQRLGRRPSGRDKRWLQQAGQETTARVPRLPFIAGCSCLSQATVSQ